VQLNAWKDMSLKGPVICQEGRDVNLAQSLTQSAELNQPIVPCSARVKLEMLQVLLHQLIQQNII